jgi:hypothetical protein
MRCFNHGDVEAVGTCKACAKGLCHECATDLGHGLSCKGEHEAVVQAYKDILDRNARAAAAARKNIAIAPIFYIFMGAVFVVYGISSHEGVGSLTFVLGCGFLAFGVVVFVRARKALIGKVDGAR